MTPLRHDDDLLARVRAMPPVDTTYRFGLWHRDRLTLRGIRVEARVQARRLITPRNEDVRKFLIIGRARSGTTLLKDLLDAHPEMTCDGEMLHSLVLAPVSYLDNLAHKSRTAAYGAKLLSYQMAQVHRFRAPARFLARLHRRGFRFVHLTRDTFDQTLSLAVAQARRKFHSTQKDRETGAVRLDPSNFRRRLEWNDLLLQYEKRALQDLPHLPISYEQGLSSEERQAETAERVFQWIGVQSRPVSSRLKKVLPKDPRQTIENYDEIASAIP